MISFLHASALLGLLAVSVPILIHLMKQRRKVLTVPSLLLFTTLRKISMKRRLRELLLLALRIAVCILLALLLARPEYKIRQPELGGASGQAVILGLLIDNSPSSLASVGGKSFLELAKERALKRISSLPEGSMVLVALSSGGLCSEPLSPSRASDLIRKISSSPLSARLGVALESLEKERLRAAELSHGRIVALVPPFEGIWREAAGVIPRSQRGLLVLEQLGGTAKGPDPWIEDVNLNRDAADNLEVLLGGNPESLTGASLLVSDGKDTIAELAIGMDDAQSGRLVIPLAKWQTSAALSLKMTLPSGLDAGPLGTCFFANSEKAPGRSDVLILYEGSQSSRLSAQIFWAALEAAMPKDSTIRAVNCAAKSEPLRNQAPAKTVIVAPLSSYSSVDKWLSECVENGSTLLLMPPLPGADLLISGIPESLKVRFGPLQKLPKSLRLELANNPGLGRNLLRSYGRGFNQAELQSIQSCQLISSDQPVLKCGAETVLALRQLPQGATLILWGIPIHGPFSARVLANPLVPQFLSALLLSQSSKPIEARCGMMLNVGQMLGLPQAHGEVQRPDGEMIALSWDSSREERLYLPEPGFYRFKLRKEHSEEDVSKSKALEFVIAANLPRSSEAAFIDTTRIAGILPFFSGFVSGEEPLSYVRFVKLSAGDGKEQEESFGYDLTPLFALILILVLIVEMLFHGIKAFWREPVLE